MNLKRSHVAAIALLAAGVILGLPFRTTSPVPEVVSATDSAPLLELRLSKLREAAATVPAKTESLKMVQGQLQTREKGVMGLATAAQAQAHLLEVVHRVAAANKIEARGEISRRPRYWAPTTDRLPSPFCLSARSTPLSTSLPIFPRSRS